MEEYTTIVFQRCSCEEGSHFFGCLVSRKRICMERREDRALDAEHRHMGVRLYISHVPVFAFHDGVRRGKRRPRSGTGDNVKP